MRRPVKYPLGHISASHSGNTAIVIFSLCTQKTSTKQSSYCAVSPALITNDSFKKKDSSDENTSLPRLLFHLHDTARNWLKYILQFIKWFILLRSYLDPFRSLSRLRFLFKSQESVSCSSSRTFRKVVCSCCGLGSCW